MYSSGAAQKPKIFTLCLLPVLQHFLLEQIALLGGFPFARSALKVEAGSCRTVR